MNSTSVSQPGLYAWSRDLEFSRDVNVREHAAFAMLLGWMEKYRAKAGLAAGREACARFWKEAVLARPREPWQLEQWTTAIKWYLRWLANRHETGGEVRGVEERVRTAVEKAGARRGGEQVGRIQRGFGGAARDGDLASFPTCGQGFGDVMAGVAGHPPAAGRRRASRI